MRRLWDGIGDPLGVAVDRLVRSVPGYVVAIIALAFYPGLGLLLPYAQNWTRGWFLAANLLGVLIAGALGLGWLGRQLDLARRRHLVDWTSDLRRLNSEEFEWFVGEVFSREGWAVKMRGRQDSPDGNVDLELIRGPDRRIVQCKRWESWLVDVNEIRAFGGTLLREGLHKGDGIYVTLSNFSAQAQAEALAMGVELVDGFDLYRRAENVRRTEPCPVCGAPMRFDRSTNGWWYHCVASGCRGKRDLGSDPGRAVEFLTLQPTRPAS